MWKLKTNGGFSVVEMLVSLVAGLVVVAGAISLFTSVMGSGNTTLMLSRLNQDVQGITDIMVRDIQRAGYHPSAAQGMDGNASAASAARAVLFSTTDDLYASSGASAPDCIRIKYWDGEPVTRIYRYDRASRELKCWGKNGCAPEGADITDTISNACTKASNSTSKWYNLIADQEISVDSLSFALASGASATGMRAIELAISASHATRPALAMSLQRQVKLRNDGY